MKALGGIGMSGNSRSASSSPDAPPVLAKSEAETKVSETAATTIANTSSASSSLASRVEFGSQTVFPEE